MTEKLMTKEEVARYLRIAVRTLDYWVETGNFPRPLKLGRRCLWPEKEVADHLACKSVSRGEVRDAPVRRSPAQELELANIASYRYQMGMLKDGLRQGRRSGE